MLRIKKIIAIGYWFLFGVFCAACHPMQEILTTPVPTFHGTNTGVADDPISSDTTRQTMLPLETIDITPISTDLPKVLLSKTYTPTPTNTINRPVTPEQRFTPTFTPETGITAFLPASLAVTTRQGFFLLNPTQASRYTKELHADTYEWIHSIAWSPGGDKLAVSATWMNVDWEYKTDVFWMAIGDQNLTKLTFAPYQKMDVSWSPDGRRILYVEVRATTGGTSLDLVSIDLENKNTTYKLTYLETGVLWPSWSPDGRQIAFLTRSGNDKYFDLMIMDQDGGNLHKITDLRAFDSPIAWSPDGAKIAFSAGKGCGQIYLIDLSSQELEQLTLNQRCAMSPTWSPDGNFLAYVGNTYGYSMASARDDWAVYLLILETRQLFKLDYELLTHKGDIPPNQISFAPVPSMQAEHKYAVTQAVRWVDLISEPSGQATRIAQLLPGETFTVLDGPSLVDGYTWWQVRVQGGAALTGWIMDWRGWYAAVSQP